MKFLRRRGASTSPSGAHEGKARDAKQPAGGLPPYLARLKANFQRPVAVDAHEPPVEEQEPVAARPEPRPPREPEPLTPVVLWNDPNPPLYTEKSPWRWTPVAAGLAALGWLVALGMLFGQGDLGERVSAPRSTLAITWCIASLLTFVPLEFRLGLPGLTWQGVLGWTLLGYILAFVPPPTGWLLDLPDLPVFLMLFAALFYAVSAACLPITFLVGRRVYQRRMHRHDLRRARRQAYELGMLAVAITMLAGLRVLSPLTALLLVAIFVLTEMLLLSQVPPEG
jgi:hypothetical protein